MKKEKCTCILDIKECYCNTPITPEEAKRLKKEARDSRNIQTTLNVTKKLHK